MSGICVGQGDRTKLVVLAGRRGSGAELYFLRIEPSDNLSVKHRDRFLFRRKEIELQAEMSVAQFFCKFLHFDLVGKNYFTIFAGGKGI